MSRKLLYLPLLAVLLQSSLFAILKRGPISMELVSEQKTVVDGKAFWLGWRIIREKGWHTYWKHPGDVGVPPKIEWMVPDGFKVGELIYALPQRVSMGKVKAHGNYGETLFLCKFESSVPLESGMLLEISGKASWLTCSSRCLPGFADLSIEIPVAKHVEYDPIWRPRFEAFRESMPRDAPANWTFQAFRNGDKIDLMLPPSVRETGGYPYLFGHGRLIRSHAPQVLRKGKNGWLLSLRRTTWGTGKEREISGLLYRKEGWGKVSFGNYLQIRVPLQ
jgi:DsbC/DsbD-like thiol-disulfide interchange protein